MYNVKEYDNNKNYKFIKLDINSKKLTKIFKRYKPIGVFNLAAETHVDRSIDNPSNFIQSNILGTFNLLESFRRFYKSYSNTKLIHISTDEVFGDVLTGRSNEDFKYKPTKQTNKEIWKYLSAANLINIEDLTDKKEIKELELAANNGQINPSIIFNIYKQVPFNLTTLINAKDLYQTIDTSEARSLIYQKYLLAEDTETQVEYLFLLEDLFKKDKLTNVFSKVLSNNFLQMEYLENE